MVVIPLAVPACWGALVYFGIDSIAATEKEEMRNLAMRGGPYTKEERQSLLDYCQSDVDALAKLFPKMSGDLDLPRAVLRGRYMKAAARIESIGIPIDVMIVRVTGSELGINSVTID